MHNNSKNIENKSKNNKKVFFFFVTVLAIVIFFIYNKTLSFGFLYTWDDNLYVTQNSHIKKLSWDNIKLLFTNFYVGNYQPVSMLTYALDYLISGKNASFFHFTNIFIHFLNSLLVFVFIKQISSKSIIPAIITSLLFAVHPMHVESVAWIAERKDVLYTFFFLISLISYNFYLKNYKIKYIVYTGIFFVLSCLSKSAAVILPFVLLLLDYYNGRKLFNSKTILEKIPFFLISLLFGIIAIKSQQTTIDIYGYDFSFFQRIAMVCYSFIIYIIKSFIPYKLSAVYPYPSNNNSIPEFYYIFILIVIVLFYLVWRSHKKGKEVIFGMSFFLVTIILVLQILPVGNAMMADRYTYVPYIGIFFIAGKFIENLMLSNEKNISQKGRFVFVITLLLALVFTIASRQRVEKWENDEVLFTDVIKKYPDCSIAYINKGWYYYNYLSEYVYKNNFSQRKKYIYKAIDDFNNAIKYAVSPETKVKAYYNSATAKAACNRHKEALQEFNAALEIDPEYYVIYINRANTEIALNDFEKAMEDLNIAVEKLPDSPIAWNSRAKIKGLQGDYKGALIDASKAIELDPYFVEAYNNRANAKSALNDKTAALQDYNKAIELNPNFDQLYVNRGIVKKEIGDINGAFADFNKAIELNPDNNIARQWLYNIEKFQ